MGRLQGGNDAVQHEDTGAERAAHQIFSLAQPEPDICRRVLAKTSGDIVSGFRLVRILKQFFGFAEFNHIPGVEKGGVILRADRNGPSDAQTLLLTTRETKSGIFREGIGGLDHSVGHFRPPQTISARANKKKNPISTILSNSCDLLYF